MRKAEIAIIIALSVISAAMGVLIASNKRQASVPAVSTALPIEKMPEESTITLSFAGDCTLGSDPMFAYGGSFHARFDEEGENYGYFFENVAPIFKEDTITFVNFEGTLTQSDERADKTYAFKGPAKYAKILTEGDVEVVSLANNHTYDFHETGFQDTKKALEAENIAYAYSSKTALFSVRPREEGKLVAEDAEKKRRGNLYRFCGIFRLGRYG